MTSKTEYDVDISVNGTQSLRQAADALAAVNENMRDMARSLNAAINGLDRLEQRFAGVRNNARAGAQGIDTLTKATEKYNKVVNTVKGQSVDLVPTAKAPAFRQPNGQFMAASAQAGVKSRADLHNQEQLNNALKIAQRNYYEAAFASSKYAHVGEELSRTLGHLSDNDLPRLRYALYDVSSTYAAVAVTLLGLSAASLKVSADFESAFTNVERTLSDSTLPAQVAGIRAELIDLSTQIPVSFEEISRIATLGNQLGIEAGDIAGFTETVAQFSAITGVATETTAQNFGTIGNLLNVAPDQYSNLASAIALTGKNSVATEAQILSLTNEIAAGAGQAGFTAQEVVGLSATLASLRVPPERSRGALTTYFETLNQAVAAGGDDLKNFATIVGVTAEQLTEMVNSGQGEDVFQGFIKGLNNLDSTEITTALDDLGLAQLRISDTFRRLSDDTALYNSTQADSARGWQENSELARQYALISDDLNTQFQLLVQSLNALVEELTGGLVPGVAGAVAKLVEFVNWLREIAKSPVAQTITGIVLATSALIGAFAAYKAVTALATASTLALVQIQRAQLGATLGQAFGVRGLITTLFGMTAATNTAAASQTGMSATSAFLTARLTTLRAAAAGAIPFIGGLVIGYTGAEALLNMAHNAVLAAQGLDRVKDAADGTVFSVDELVSSLSDELAYIEKINEANAKLDQSSNGAQILNLNLADSKQEIAAVDKELSALVNSGNFEQIESELRAAGVSAASAAKMLPQYTAAMIQLRLASTDFSRPTVIGGVDSLASSIGKVGTAAGGAAKKVVTLKDYASDLAGVFQRAFELRFDSQGALDSITSEWRDLNEELEEYQRKVMQLTADRSITQYFLSVAEAYGDTLRAGVLRSDLADIEADLADAQSITNKTLVGNSKAAVNNRKVITGLVSEYEEYIEKLAASGASQSELQAATAQARIDFLTQAQALGFSSNELGIYAAAFDDVALAIQKVPRSITVAFNGNPALQAINEFMAQARATLGGSISGPTLDDASIKKAARGQKILADIAYMLKKEKTVTSASASQAISNEITRLTNLLNSNNYATGGRISGPGTATSDSIGIMASDGEYMIKTSSASKLGTPLLNYLNKYGRLPGYAAGGAIGIPVQGSATGVTEWGSWERRVLMQIARNTAQQPVIAAQSVTNAVNATNANASTRRSA